jgi:hypothetical protein
LDIGASARAWDKARKGRGGVLVNKTNVSPPHPLFFFFFFFYQTTSPEFNINNDISPSV